MAVIKGGNGKAFLTIVIGGKLTPSLDGGKVKLTEKIVLLHL